MLWYSSYRDLLRKQVMTEEQKGGPSISTPQSKCREWDLARETIPSGSETRISPCARTLGFLSVRSKPVMYVKTVIRNQDAKSATQICKQHFLVSAALTRGRLDVKCNSHRCKTFHFKFWKQVAGEITLCNKTVHFFLVLLFTILKYFPSTSLNIVFLHETWFFFSCMQQNVDVFSQIVFFWEKAELKTTEWICQISFWAKTVRWIYWKRLFPSPRQRNPTCCSEESSRG